MGFVNGSREQYDEDSVLKLGVNVISYSVRMIA